MLMFVYRGICVWCLDTLLVVCLFLLLVWGLEILVSMVGFRIRRQEGIGRVCWMI